MSSLLRTPSFDLETSYPCLVAGIDEAGCGPWAGPVVAGACVFVDKTHPLLPLNHIHDSKKLTAQKRENVFDLLTQLPATLFQYGIGIASVEEIDTLSLGKATRLAMQRAMTALSVKVEIVLVDGIRKPDLPQPVIPVVKGDQKSFSIAAASICAKVTRDRLMQVLDQDFPQYGWGQNAGYGTAKHQAAIKAHGVTIHHRRSFAPIKKYL